MHKKYKGLCISAGGSNGFLMLGALQEFQKNDQLSDLTHFAGSSFGSLVVSLLAIGYQPIEMLTISCDSNITNYFSIFNVMNLSSISGLYSNGIIKNKLEELMMLKLGYIPTFSDLYKLNKHLTIPIYCLGDINKKGTLPVNERKIFCSYETTPDMKISDACVLSCSIPIIFQKAIYKDNVYIDGVFNTIFPIHKLEEIIPNENILGLSLENIELDLNTFYGYIMSIITLSIEKVDYSLLHNTTDILQLKIPNNTSGLSLDITTQQKIKLYIDGTIQGQQYLKNIFKEILKDKND